MESLERYLGYRSLHSTPKLARRQDLNQPTAKLRKFTEFRARCQGSSASPEAWRPPSLPGPPPASPGRLSGSSLSLLPQPRALRTSGRGTWLEQGSGASVKGKSAVLPNWVQFEQQGLWDPAARASSTPKCCQPSKAESTGPGGKPVSLAPL